MSTKFLASATVCTALLLPSPSLAQKREMQQMLRDMALLQETLRLMEQNNSERLAGLEALIKQNLEQQDKLAAGQAVIEKRVATMDEALTEPQRAVTAKVDSLTSQFVGLRATVEEMGASTERLQADVRDIKTHLTTIPAPLTDEEGEMQEPSAIASAESIFEGAMADYARGDLANARGQFIDYLTHFRTHGKAGDAQYYLAETYYDDSNFEQAELHFGLVYEKFPLSNLAPDALLKQGMSLREIRGREDDAKGVFESIIKFFPDSSAARHARSELNQLLNSKPRPGL